MRWSSLYLLPVGLLGCSLILAGCGQEAASPPPPPQEVGDAASGRYCGMPLKEHPGPKAQLFLKSQPDKPVWFISVSDAIAFTLLPEEPKDIAALYVTDMGRATNWDQPEAATWIEAHQAWFVIGSARAGGMGAPEAVPFGTLAAAETFRAAHGGKTVGFASIPQGYVLGGDPGAKP